MNTRLPKKLVAFIAFASLMSMAAMQAALNVGSKAPALPSGTWVKGDAVGKFEGDKAYVVEFWATWCGPCVNAIPHLTKLQKKYPDKLVVIGVAAAEKKAKEGADQRLDKLKKFVSRQGSKMGYRVVFDESQGSWSSWMRAAGKNGIPCTFVVDHTGKIAWIGSPTRADAAVEAVIRALPKKSKADGKGDKDKTSGKDGKSDSNSSSSSDSDSQSDSDSSSDSEKKSNSSSDRSSKRDSGSGGSSGSKDGGSSGGSKKTGGTDGGKRAG